VRHRKSDAVTGAGVAVALAQVCHFLARWRSGNRLRLLQSGWPVQDVHLGASGSGSGRLAVDAGFEALGFIGVASTHFPGMSFRGGEFVHAAVARSAGRLASAAWTLAGKPWPHPHAGGAWTLTLWWDGETLLCRCGVLQPRTPCSLPHVWQDRSNALPAPTSFPPRHGRRNSWSLLYRRLYLRAGAADARGKPSQSQGK